VIGEKRWLASREEAKGFTLLINAQIAAPPLWAIRIGCPKNDTLRIVDEGTVRAMLLAAAAVHQEG